MKTSNLIALIFLSLAVSARSQSSGSAASSTLPVPTPYSVVARSANSAIWQRQTYEQGPNATIITNVHRYMQLSTGLNRLSNGKWVPSSDAIEISPDGTSAYATNCQHKLYFPGDIGGNVIKLITPAGQILESQAIGLALSDGSNSVLLAVVTNSTGAVLPSGNEVIYMNAFAGLNADLLYKNTLAGIEQDVVLHEQPPDPSILGLNSTRARLQMLTEFISSPQPNVSATTVPTTAGNLEDDQLSFGAMQMVHGKAFLLGTNSLTVGVEKRWVTLNSRQFLIEEVPVASITNALSNLSPYAGRASSLKAQVASGYLLPPPHRLAHKLPKPIFLAQATLPDRGLVLDYVTLNSSQSNYIFRGDVTYLISGTVNLYGTNTFEGGTVIKYTNSTTAQIVVNNALACKTGSYRPAVFTDMNDNSVGEAISSSGNPSVNTASYLVLNGAYSYTLNHFRFNYAGYGLTISGGNAAVWDSQFAHCNYGLSQNGGLNCYNVLLVQCNYAFYFPSWYNQSFCMENATVDVTNLWNVAPNTVNATNCLVRYYATPSNPTTLNFNQVYMNPSGAIFQTVGGGSYYLATNSIYRGLGTTNINSALLADLQTNTTYPPMVYSNARINISLPLTPFAQRDTDAPDVGYHYDPLDYVFGGCDLYTNLTVTSGAVVGWYQDSGSVYSYGQPYGISLNDGANFTLTGTVNTNCWITSAKLVQEGGNGNWVKTGWIGGIWINGSGGTNCPQINAHFTKWSDGVSQANDFRDTWVAGDGRCSFSDCEFYIGGMAAYGLRSLSYSNCLFERISLFVFDPNATPVLNLKNCTFFNGLLVLYRYSGIPPVFWTIKDTTFDGTAFYASDYLNGNSNYTAFDYNAYNLANTNWNGYPYPYGTTVGTLEVTGPHDITVTNGYNWQSSWYGNYYLPTDSLLLNAGDVTADQVGLYHFTTQTNQVPESNSIVDIGYHYVAANQYGNPLDSNGDGTPDYLQDANGNGVVDNGETNWALAILVQPANQTVAQGSNAVFSMTAGGIVPIQYQWFSNAVLLANTTNATLTLSNVQPASAGNYQVVVSNSFGALTSSAATLTVVAPPTIAITNPADGMIFTSPTNITLMATASNAIANIVQVQFFAGTNSLGVVAGAPYNLIWSNVPAGTYALTAVASNSYGLSSTSAPVNIGVLTFLMGINLNGPSVTIESNIWESYSYALTNGFSVSNAMPGSIAITNLNPATDTDTSNMLQTFVRHYRLPAPAPSQTVSVEFQWFQPVNAELTVALTNVPTGSIVTNQIPNNPATNWYLGWCLGVANGNVGPGAYYACALAYSCGYRDPTVFDPSIVTQTRLNEINYILNNKTNCNQYEIQNAIWAMMGRTDRESDGLTANFTNLMNAAFTNGPAFIPTNNQVAAVLEGYTQGATTNVLPILVETTNLPVGFTLTQTNLNSGNDTVCLWLAENEASYLRNLTIKVQGSVVATGVGTNLVLDQWTKLGPYPANITNGTLTVEVDSPIQGDPQLMGLAVYGSGGETNTNSTPFVQIVSPVNQTLLARSNVVISAIATNSAPGATIEGVEFFSNITNDLGFVSVPSSNGLYELEWIPPTPGTNILEAFVTNSLGFTAWSAPVTNYIRSLPIVSITSPNDGEIFPLTNAMTVTNITITATAAADGVGITITNVAFYQGTAFLASVTNLPYQIIWPFTNGTNHLTARATDSTGASGVSFPVNITITSTNQPPFVYAGANQTTNLPYAQVELTGLVSDDGLPSNYLAVAWSQLIGPGTVAFGNSTQAMTTATFSTNGTYLLQLTASDGELTSTSTMTVLVLVSNAPPSVSAGPDQTVTNTTLGITTPIGVELHGYVTDDGNPTNGTLISTWSVTSGPGAVTFADINATNTIATFYQPGSYGLQLIANDGQLSTTSTVTVTIVSLDAIPYQATNYLYTYPFYTIPIGDNSGVPPDNSTDSLYITNYYTTNFDDSSWTNGQGGFGYGAYLSPGDIQWECASSLDNSNFTKTFWPGQTEINYPSDTNFYPYLYLRRHFNIPPGTTNLSMGFTVDNSAKIYINGMLITPVDIYSNGAIVLSNNVAHAIFVTNYVTGSIGYFDTNALYFIHGGCPDPDDLILNGISTNVWHTNDNLLAVCVYDGGGACFYDNQISFNTDIIGGNSPPAGISNSPPLVYAGSDQFVALINGSATIQLTGLVADDGLPGTGQAMATWTNVSGPGTVYFSQPTSPFTNYNVLPTSATFYSPGVYTNQLIADDGQLSSTSSVVIFVDPGEIPPPVANLTAPASNAVYQIGDTIPMVATATASSGTIAHVDFYAYSSAGNLLVGRATSSPYTFNWNIPAPGNYALMAAATDSGGRVGYSPQVNIQVLAITNHPPVAMDDQFVVKANSINDTFYPLTNDYDADSNTVNIISLGTIGTHGNVVIINNGTAINYTPPSGKQGFDGFQYEISDDHGGTAWAQVLITIYAGALPSVTLTPENYTTGAGAADALTASNWPSQYIAKVDFYQGQSLLGTVTNETDGNYTLNWTATYQDCGCGFTAQATDTFGQVNTSPEIHISVTNNPDIHLPSASLVKFGTNVTTATPLTNYVTIRDGLFNVYGTAYQDQGSDVIWQLGIYSVDGMTLLRSLASGTNSNNPNLSAACDLSSLQNGGYDLRLTAISEYMETNVDVSIILDTGLKLGQFSFSQQDLVIPVNGIPLSITRTYNSMNPDKGDFGYGWIWAINSMDVSIDETRQTTTDNDHQVFSERESGNWDVTLTLPNGRRTTFYYSVVGPNLGGEYIAEWLPEPGVTAALTNLDHAKVSSFLSGGKPVWTSGDSSSQDVPYNNFDFSSFVLTTQDGTQYFISRQDLQRHFIDNGGMGYFVHAYGAPYLSKIVERNGDQIQIGTDAITYSSTNNATREIAIQRNSDGLISAITDPNGVSGGPPTVVYQYDNNDNLIAVERLTDTNNGGIYITNSFTYTNANFPHYITGIINGDGTQVAENFYDDSGKLVKIKDAEGNTTQFIHDTTNSMEVVIDRMNNTNTYVYDARGNVIIQTNALSQVSTMAYDDNNNKTNEITYLANGQPYATNSYAYDDTLNLMVSATDPLNQTSRYAYDSYGELTNSVDARGNGTTNIYDPNTGNLLSTSDALGDTTVNYYSGDLLVGSKDALRNVTTNYYDQSTGYLTASAMLQADSLAILSSNSFTYDANGNRLTSTVWRQNSGGGWIGATTTNVYDAMNRVIETINPDGGNNAVIYNAIGQQAATVDALGHTNTFLYDLQGRLKETIYPDGTTTSSTYDGNGNRVSSTDQNEHVTTYQYDGLNRLTNTIYPDLTTSRTVYDDLGRVAETIDGRGIVTAFGYDAAGRRTAMTNAVGSNCCSTNFYSYDANGNQITFTDADGHTTTNVYDVLNRQTETIYPNATTNSVGYDANGRKVAVTNQDGVVTLFGYDGSGRLTSVTNAAGTSQPDVTLYVYDQAGNEVVQIDALNRTNMFSYDDMGRRITHMMPTNGLIETFAYDVAGNMVLDTNFNGVIITNEYDAMNRLTNQASVNSYQVTFAYSPTGQRTNMTDTSSTTSYAYDNRDRLQVKTTYWSYWLGVSLNYAYDANGNTTNIWSSTANGVDLAYSYDALNRLTNVLDNGGEVAGYGFDSVGNLQSIRYGNGVTNLYQYDTLNRLTNLVWKLNTSPRASFAYQLRLSGNRTNSSEIVNGYTHGYSWNYDALYRLTNETLNSTAPIGTLGYQYDSVGNRTNRSGSLGSLGLQTPTYDANDRVNGDIYDNNGNTTASGADTYQYDVLNHITNATVNGVQVLMGYDGDGNRVSKTVGGTTTYYLLDDCNPSGQVQVLEEYRDYSLSNVYNYGLALISQRTVISPLSTNYFVYDGRGSTRMLTDAGGTFVNDFTYDAFGTVIASYSAPQTTYLYCGQQFDPDLGLYYNRARYLNPNTGRFWTMDSYEGNNEDPLSLHKYLYAQDNPVNLTDPSGHDSLGEVMVAMDISVGLDALLGISLTPMGMAASLPEKILPVHAYSLRNPTSLSQIDFGQASEAVKDANAILAQAAIKMQLNASDFHLWDADTTRQRAGDSMRVYLGPRDGTPGKNWGTITARQDRTVANVYFSGTFQKNDQGELAIGVGGMTAEKGPAKACYPAVFLVNPWGSNFAHEIGHLLGSLEHNFSDENRLMYWNYPGKVLTKDEINKMRTSELLR